MRSRSISRLSVAALLGLALLVPAATSAAGAGAPGGPGPAADPSVVASVTLNVCGYGGNAANIPGNVLTVKHRSASGALRKTYGVTVTAGQWEVPCPGPRVRGGDRLQFLTSLSTTPFRELVIPRLKLRPDRVHDRLRGNAPGNPDLAGASAGKCDPALRLCFKGLPVLLSPAGSSGAFTIPMAGLDGTSRTVLFWQKDDDEVVLIQQAARMAVRPGSAAVTGLGVTAGQKLTVSLRRGQAVGRATPTSKADSTYRGTFRRGGKPMKARAGDLVSGSFASDATLRVPATSIAINDTGDGVVGRCFKNAPVTVEDFGFDGSFLGFYQTTSGPTGRWSVTLGPLSAGHTFRAWCGTPKGDAVVFEFRAV